MIRDVVPDQQHVYIMTNLNEIKNFQKKLKPKLQTLLVYKKGIILFKYSVFLDSSYTKIKIV